MKILGIVIGFILGVSIFVVLYSYVQELYKQDLIANANRIGNATMKEFETDVLPSTQKTVMINGQSHVFINPNASRAGASCGVITADEFMERNRVECEKKMYDKEGKMCPIDVCVMNILPHGLPTPDLCTIHLTKEYCGEPSEYGPGPSGCAYTVQYEGLTDCIGMPHPKTSLLVITLNNGSHATVTIEKGNITKIKYD